MRLIRTFIASLVVPVIAATVAIHGEAWEQQDEKIQQSQKQKSDTKYGLQLSIESDGKRFRSDDVIKLKVKLKNVGKAPLTLYKELAWGESASLNMYISDVQGRVLTPDFIDDSLPHPPFLKEDFIILQPGEPLEEERPIDLRQYEIKEMESYRITVSYSSPVPREFAPEDLDIWAAENGRLVSKPIQFKVIKKSGSGSIYSR